MTEEERESDRVTEREREREKERERERMAKVCILRVFPVESGVREANAVPIKLSAWQKVAGRPWRCIHTS